MSTVESPIVLRERQTLADAAVLLAELVARGVEVSLADDGAHLDCDGGSDVLAPEVIAQLVAHKPAIIALLRARSAPPAHLPSMPPYPPRRPGMLASRRIQQLMDYGLSEYEARRVEWLER